MLLISRERPTAEGSVYLEVRVNPMHKTMWPREFKIEGGRHHFFEEEWECYECDTYGGGDYRSIPDQSLDVREGEYLKVFFIILMEVRNGEDNRTDSEAGDRSTDQEIQEGQISETVEGVLRSLTRSGY